MDLRGKENICALIDEKLIEDRLEFRILLEEEANFLHMERIGIKDVKIQWSADGQVYLV